LNRLDVYMYIYIYTYIYMSIINVWADPEAI
jgi:hypothetical protein